MALFSFSNHQKIAVFNRSSLAQLGSCLQGGGSYFTVTLRPPELPLVKAPRCTSNCLMKVGSFSSESTMTAKAFVLINADLGAERDVIDRIKSIPNVVEVHVVYGVYDIVAKVEAESLEKVKETITDRLRTLEKVRSTLTMIVVESQS